MKEDKYEIEGLSPDAFNLYVVQPKQPRKLICTATSEIFARVIIIALMELDKNRKINWDNP
jgi:hypothetical protein